MLYLTPKSSTTASGRPSSAGSIASAGPDGVHQYGSAQVTRSASPSPSIDGLLRAFSTSESASRSADERQARMTPLSRRWRVSARVSMPQMPGTPRTASRSSSRPVERQLCGASHTSRHTTACARRRSLSQSSSFTP
jgi:hypothetical protein